MKRKLLILIFALLILSAPLYAGDRVIVLSWDGGADWIMDRLLAEGQMPNVAKLAASGVRAEYMTSSYPSLTAAAHASLWTGAYGNINGVTGNNIPELPFKEHTLLESLSGFKARALLAEPIWMTAVRSGKRVAALQVTQSESPSYYSDIQKREKIPQDRLYLTNAFGLGITSSEALTDISKWQSENVTTGVPAHNGEVLVMRLKLGDTPFTSYIFDSTTDPVQGYDTLEVVNEALSEKAILKPGFSTPGTIDRFSQPFQVRKGDLVGYTHFRLFELSPDGKSLLFYHTSAGAVESTQPDKAAKYLAAAGGIYDNEFWMYERGSLGKPLVIGGDGSAEQRVVELARLVAEKLKRGTAYGIANLQWDLLIHYSPLIDSAEHTWLGVLDPSSPTYNAQTADKIWPYLKQVYGLNDEWLGEVVKDAPAGTDVILVSDHGMKGIADQFFTNRLFEKAGLTAFTSEGQIDLTKSKAVALGDGASIYINTTEHKGGIVPLVQKDAVMQEATTLLLSTVDPATNRSIVTKVFKASDAQDVGTGGPRGADLMIDLADGYAPTGDKGAFGTIIKFREPIGVGMHGGFPYHPRLRAVFFAAGPGIAKGKLTPPMRTIDVAPSISHLLGIRRPADAVGDPVGTIFPL